MDFSFQSHDDVRGAPQAATGTDAAPALIERIALLGNFLPRRCGIATFTTDIYHAFESRFPDIAVDVWAMNDGDNRYAYPEAVRGSINANDPESYRAAAREIEGSDADLLWIQHEFGIFGGSAGDYLLPLLDRMTCPIAVTLHTILSEPDADQRRVMDALVERCQSLIVMAEEGRRILIDTYGADPVRVSVIPHGIPDRAFGPTAPMKERLGLTGHDVVLTFGLLSKGKGIETMIEAMPAIVAKFPKTLYVVLGATHPHTIANDGESYRDQLKAQAELLGVGANIRWVDSFVETSEVLDYLEAADIYATPYLNPAQITSGTLAYAVGLGKPVVSTPYVHARELLADDHGRLVGFGDSAGFAKAIVDLLSDRNTLEALRERTYALGRTMIWPRFAEVSLAQFSRMPALRTPRPLPSRSRPIPARLPLTAIERMSDATGMLQHSVFSIPDRAHGYCVDDNARALILMCRNTGFSAPDRARWTGTYAAFVQHAWNPDTQAFRNFMGFDRTWLEDTGSCDSRARTVWSLAIAATEASDPAIRQWARGLFDTTLPATAERTSLRTRAFLMLAASAMLTIRSGDAQLTALLTEFGEDLIAQLEGSRRADWCWFETVLAYDNARLPEALLRAGLALDRNDFVVRGLETLTWISDRQTATEGHFRAVGSDSFGRPFAPPLRYDQQPLEAWAMVDACEAAFAATHDDHWKTIAIKAYRWFLGENDLGLAIADSATGECCDGLMPTGINRNQGAESVLSFHIATYAINQLLAESFDSETRTLGEFSIMRHQALDVIASPISAQAPRRPLARRGPSIPSRLEQPRAV
ncbi:glycosyltransferase family 4 protein [Sphingomonas sp.]|uniref:glycosyltransferase family 4 protein n=1 Tax=Sphingomonas sp. TaxID=28214 RepID=UPI0025E4ACAA|nr:glycosyltransferase family 4 protein [Sphingomonas sp.]